MTHDYKRHGTTTLFAALDVLEELLADIPIAAYIRSFNRG